MAETRPVYSDLSSKGSPLRRISIPNRHGENLVGLLHEAGSVEIVVLCHGFRSSKDDRTILSLASSLEAEGISSFRFDFAGNGESDGSFQYGNYWGEAEDLRCVVQHFLDAQRKVDAIAGHSKGGDVVLLYASKYPDVVHKVINLSGRYDLSRGVEERLGSEYRKRIEEDGYFDVTDSEGRVKYRVTEESLKDRLRTDVHRACLEIRDDCNVLTVHGSSDEVIPVEDAINISKLVRNHSLRIIGGADHSYGSSQAELSAVVLDFLKG